MSATSTSNRSFPIGASLAAWIVSTLTIALVGCIVISATLPFVKAALVSQHLDIARAGADDRQQSARTINLLQHLQPVLKPYRKHTAEGYRLLARAHAARGEYDDANKAAKEFYRWIVSPPSASMQQANFPARWGAQLYNRITADQITDDPWIGYREAAQQYRDTDDERGMQHLQEHLDRHYTNHPWHNPEDRDLAKQEPEIDPVEEPAPAPPTPPAPEDDGEPKPQWGLPLTDGASAYNRHREHLRDIPAGTLLDIHEHTVWDSEPMVQVSVHIMNRWVSNIFLRTAQIAINQGCARDISDREKRLHIKRLGINESIRQEEKRMRPDPPPGHNPDDASAPAIPRENARRQLRELEQKLAGLEAEAQQAKGARRVELIDELRRLGNQRFRLQQAAAGVVETLDDNRENTESGTLPQESPLLQRLRRQLEDIEIELQRLVN